VIKISCNLSIQVLQPNGNPASFAALDVFEVVRFLFWEFDVWVTARRADFYGFIRIKLPYKKYRFRFVWGGKETNIWATLNRSDVAMTVWMPR